MGFNRPIVMGTRHVAARGRRTCWDGGRLKIAAIEAGLFGAAAGAENGHMAVSQGPGLGCDPDPAVIRQFRIERRQ